MKVRSGQTTKWLLHVHEHLLRLNVAPYSLEMSENTGNSYGLSDKALDSVPHNIVSSKLKQVNINPYIINWLISFLDQRKQRVVVDGYRTKFVSQGTVLGPFLFSIDIKAVNTNEILLVKFADDITVSLPIEANVGLEESESLNGPRTTA